MNETKRLTLEKAKSEIAELKRLNSGHCYVNDCLKQAESILARVEMPSEEDRAVLWLIQRHGWEISSDCPGEWIQRKLTGGDIKWVPFNPIEEAKKLGWGGGE